MGKARGKPNPELEELPAGIEGTECSSITSSRLSSETDSVSSWTSRSIKIDQPKKTACREKTDKKNKIVPVIDLEPKNKSKSSNLSSLETEAHLASENFAGLESAITAGSGDNQVSVNKIYFIGIFFVVSLISVWIGFFFHVISVAPWDYLKERWTDEFRSRSDVVAGLTATVTTTAFGGLTSIIIPAIVAFYIVFTQCNSLYATTTFRLVMDGLYLLFLVVTMSQNILYQVVLFDNAGALDINVDSFSFICGWISIGFFGVGLIFAIVYLVYAIIAVCNEDYY